MLGSDDVPPGSTPPTTSTVATSIDVTAAATGPISQADFMAFQQLLVQQFAALTVAINDMSSSTPPPPPPPASATSVAAFPYGVLGYGGIAPLPTTIAHCHHHRSLPICHNTPSIIDLHLGATSVKHARIHPSDCISIDLTKLQVICKEIVYTLVPILTDNDMLPETLPLDGCTSPIIPIS
jgi:hypothetical protein